MTTLIYNVTDLQNMQNDLAGDYELANDIDASATSGWNGGAGFDPIGNYGARFTGSLDGKNYIVSDLFIDRPTEDEVGPLGSIDEATIVDITFSNVDITGDDYVGGAIGEAYGNCSISNVVTTGAVNGDRFVGGFIGYLSTSAGLNINDSYSECVVTATGNYYGGFGGELVAYTAQATISGCYAIGAVIGDSFGGGFVGYIYGESSDYSKFTFSGCYATGNITANTSEDYIGGFAGWWEYAKAVDCYATGDVDCGGGIWAGGFLG